MKKNLGTVIILLLVANIIFENKASYNSIHKNNKYKFSNSFHEFIFVNQYTF